MTHDPRFSHFQKLRVEDGKAWTNLCTAQVEAVELRDTIAKKVLGRTSSDAEVVLFGSLARGEWTEGSDIDWTLLLDGGAATAHQTEVNDIDKLLGEIEFQDQKLHKPGQSGLFGATLTFSHDLVHQLGGAQDTNTNTTRRMLLLLESFPVHGFESESAYSRTVLAVIDRYLSDDPGFQGNTTGRPPRFLLNDIVRFWRTLCVDFGMKRWTKPTDEKWALRTIKLRMSRKLLFASGLLMMHACAGPVGAEDDDAEQKAVRLLREYSKLPPLEILAREFAKLDLAQPAVALIDLYDQFLGLLRDGELREYLTKIKPDEAKNDLRFTQFTDLGRAFQRKLVESFLETEGPLRTFTLEYGVF